MAEGLWSRVRRLARRDEPGDGERAVLIPCDRIDPSPFQPRERLDEQELAELARSIQELGLLQPIIVRRVGERYQIVAGERRWRAAQAAGLKAVPALVRDLDDGTAAVAALVENLQRSDLSFWEEAAGYQRLLAEFGLTQEELAAAVGKSQPAVANKLRLLKLPADVRELAQRAGLGERHVRALLRLEDPELQREAVRLMAEAEMTAREAEELVQALQRQGTAARGRRPRARGALRMISDLRVVINTFRQGVEALQRAGLDARLETRYGDDAIEIHIRIPRRADP